ncbi:MAG TPA: hypothetical protein VFM18_23660 [Methanosarcina sp.]|nr:hypothetical protein [Methanosarcina sp.]
MSLGKSLFQLAYEKSPIFLTDGIASFVPGKILPLISITQSGDFTQNVLNGNLSINFDDFYATFKPLAGATLHNNQIGSYPFANQKVAANAIIAQPLNISLLMNTTPRLRGGMISKVMTATALKNALDNHNFQGGTYTILTPSFMYEGCIMTSFKDITTGESKHVQTDWQIDFIQPLTTEKEANSTMNALMQKLTNGLPTGVNWSGIPGL